MQQRIKEAAEGFPDVACALAGDAALGELLKGRTAYGGEDLSSTLAAFDNSRVSVPQDVSGAPFVEDLLPAEASQQLKDYLTHMMRTPEEVEELKEMHGEAGRHVDPVLLQRPKEYAQFVWRASEIGLVDFTQTCRCQLGIFLSGRRAVRRSDSSRIAVLPAGSFESPMEYR